MPVHPELLEILVCPETKQSLKMAAPELLERVNTQVKTGELRNRSGSPVEKALSEALVREDGRLLYPVDDGIPVMLLEEAIEL